MDKKLTLLTKCLAEFIGTWMLTFSILGAISTTKTESGGGEYTQVCFVHGFALFTLAMIFGPISGAHFNPAVSLSFAVQRQLSILEFLCYVLSQLIGGIMAGLLTYFLWNDLYRNALWTTTPFGNHKNGPLASMFFWEFIGTFILIVAIQTSVNKRNPLVRSPLSDVLLVSGTITFIGLAGILKYAGINPAREFGPRLFGAMAYGSVAFSDYTWVPIIAPLLASPLAVLFYKGLARSYPKVRAIEALEPPAIEIFDARKTEEEGQTGTGIDPEDQ